MRVRVLPAPAPARAARAPAKAGSLTAGWDVPEIPAEPSPQLAPAPAAPPPAAQAPAPAAALAPVAQRPHVSPNATSLGRPAPSRQMMLDRANAVAQRTQGQPPPAQRAEPVQAPAQAIVQGEYVQPPAASAPDQPVEAVILQALHPEYWIANPSAVRAVP